MGAVSQRPSSCGLGELILFLLPSFIFLSPYIAVSSVLLCLVLPVSTVSQQMHGVQKGCGAEMWASLEYTRALPRLCW